MNYKYTIIWRDGHGGSVMPAFGFTHMRASDAAQARDRFEATHKYEVCGVLHGWVDELLSTYPTEHRYVGRSD